MPAVFDALPGQEVPVGGLSTAFERLWAGTPAHESRAVQLNLVLHLARNTTPEDGVARFADTLGFAHRYPCRVVVLCPDYDGAAPAEIRSKIYGECFPGKSHRDLRCVEFVLLHYTVRARQHLENQVSVCLAPDMPLYYWAHRFADVRRLADYGYLLTRSRRIMFDGALVPADAFTYPWPNLSAVRDLAYTRTLPLRQNLGQFLSRYPPALIHAGLRRVALQRQETLAAEGNSLLGWVRKGLVRCGASLASLETVVEPGPCGASFELAFTYEDRTREFRWEADLAGNEARFSGDLGSGRSTLVVGAQLLAAEAALAEAMFF